MKKYGFRYCSGKTERADKHGRSALPCLLCPLRGSLVNSGRQQFSAWWLVIFPDMAIFITVAAHNLLGDGLRDTLDPQLKT